MNKAKRLHFWACFSAIYLLLGAPVRAEEKLFAIVVGVEGKGNARVRRAMGTETVVGAQMELFPGDRVFTDEGSTVDIALVDGTLIRLGIRAELKLVEARATTWTFQLNEGALRALSESSKIKIQTSVATLKVAEGSEMVVEHDKILSGSSVFALGGEGRWGTLDCEEKKNCLAIPAGKFSRLLPGEKSPAAVADFSPKEIYGLTSSATLSPRLTLFQSVARVNTAFMATMSDEDLKKSLAKEREKFVVTQDELLGRNEEIRQAMQRAKKENTFARVVQVADAYSAAGEAPFVNVGPLAAQRFNLGKTIVDTPIFARSFGDPEKNSEALKLASAWSVEAKSGKGTKIKKVLDENPAVQVAKARMVAMTVLLKTQISEGCADWCAATRALLSEKKTLSSTVSTEPLANARATITCAHPTVTCALKPCDAKAAKNCKPEKICKKTCR